MYLVATFGTELCSKTVLTGTGFPIPGMAVRVAGNRNVADGMNIPSGSEEQHANSLCNSVTQRCLMRLEYEDHAYDATASGGTIDVESSCDRSPDLRGNASADTPRRLDDHMAGATEVSRDAERPRQSSHKDRGDDECDRSHSATLTRPSPPSPGNTSNAGPALFHTHPRPPAEIRCC